MHAVDRDLTPFKKSGGKLITYTGWLDPVVPPQDTAAYYEGVAKVMGGYDKTRDFYRFFLAPGMGHCAGGPGPNRSTRSPRSRTGSRKASRRTVDRHERTDGRSIARGRSAVSAGRAVYRHGQHGRGREFLMRGEATAAGEAAPAAARDERRRYRILMRRGRVRPCGPGDLVVVDEMAHARIDPRRHVARPFGAQTSALSRTRGSGTCASTSLQPKNIGVPSNRPDSFQVVPGGPIAPPLKATMPPNRDGVANRELGREARALREAEQ